ncbi:3-carboxy-cis,cis-muconate cycloisomerase [Aeromicrobium phragmitis]|uniref:3-carboxy-cis,cis-muconate cycloisomerase n=1 Tax=Aeromicrobium phragmitis TaxID=2478914 RepID=A0A3L8PTT7_9ACTN|nr:lyase family protein [Aeromicrobium phragmitis]RLV57432.1 3-carboxy-cis,cis-muconate cycloisomerase [Aeromicrobium phragmitis]
MSNLLWPGDERAGRVFSDAAVVEAMVAVEDAWLWALVGTGVAPASAAGSLTGFIGDDDVADLATGAESGGNPVIGLVALLRERTDGETSRWLHRGLTSQDVLDTALVLCARDAINAIDEAVRGQLGAIVRLATEHRDTPMVARTLTQPAVPQTFGAKVARWGEGIVDAAAGLRRVRSSLPVQLGGAAGTMAAATELSGDQAVALALVRETAEHLGLDTSLPWHTSRGRLTEIGDAFVTCTDAWGHVAADVLVMTRPGIGEVSEGTGGSSSTMPHKSNPVMSVLLRRTALVAPGLAQTLHLAAATMEDERASGAWHAEWDALRLLARRTLVAARHAEVLLGGLRVDVERMSFNLASATGVEAEQQSMVKLTGRLPSSSYLGIAPLLADSAVSSIRDFLEEDPA